MKKTAYTILILAGLFMTCGCAQIDIEPLTNPTKETWFKNADDLKMSVDALYSYKQWDIEGYRQYNLDMWSDDWFQNTITNDPGPTGNLTSDHAFVQARWKNTYRSIMNANSCINSARKLREANDNAELKTLEGEALFMRACYYSYIIFFWGDAPYYTDELNIAQAEAMVRTPKKEILQHIYEDFDLAETLLPAKNEGRVCKSTVAPFKARTALWCSDWATAAAEAKKCIDSKAYSLDPDWQNVHKPKSTSKEWIMAIPRSRSLDDASKFATTNFIPRIIGGYTGNLGPSWELLLSFLCTDGKPVDESPLYDPHKPFKNRDPRCAYTIVEFGSTHLGYEYSPEKLKVKDPNGKSVSNVSSPLVGNGSPTSALYLRKGVDETWIDDKYAENNIPVLRYADVLLMYAEAKIELNEIDATVLNAINDVRSRAYGVKRTQTNDYPAVVSTSQSELRTAVRFERRMELAFENKRYFDIIRWRVADICMNRPQYQCLLGLTVNGDYWKSDLGKLIKSGDFFFTNKALPDVDENGLVDLKPLLATKTIRQHTARYFPERQYLFPIPSYDIITAPNLTQNPGY